MIIEGSQTRQNKYIKLAMQFSVSLVTVTRNICRVQECHAVAK